MIRDRDGSEVEPDEATPAHYCQAGWTGTDPEGRPIPCLLCKPHLAKRRTFR